MNENEHDILEMMTRHELALKELYEVFSILFPDYKGFWQQLATDERRHADWIETLRSNPDAGSWFLHDSQLRLQATKASIGYVESQTTRAKEGKFSLLQAVSIAKDLESALIERHLSKIQDSAPQDMKSILMKLSDETKRHLKAVVEIMNLQKQ